MAELLSPFLNRPVKCPVCARTHTHRMFRVHLFMPKDIEDDQHVAAYRWQAPNTKPVHPPYFALYHCPHCYFTDLVDDFREPARCKNSYFILKTFGAFQPEIDRLVEFMGRHLDYEKINFHSALTLHYLTLFIQSTIPEDVQDTFKIGRLALRIAWLFREENAGLEVPDGPLTCKGQPYSGFSSYQDFLLELRQHWPEAPTNEEESTRFACSFIEKAIASDTRFDRPAKYYQGVKLLLCLLNRQGNLDRAYDTVRGIYAQGSQSRLECQRTLSKPETSQHVREQIVADLRVVNTYMADAGALRDELLDKMVERDYPKVLDTVRANLSLPPKELEKAVLQAGVLPEVFRRIQEKLAATVPQK